MPQTFPRRSIAWIRARREWWLALALLATYAALLVNGRGDTLGYTVCALPVTGALLLALIAHRHVSTFALLSAGVVGPPVLFLVVDLLTPRPPHIHPCNIGPVIVLGFILLGGVQAFVMGVLAALFRGVALYVLQRRARSQ